MKNYELLYIISPNITPQEVKEVFGEVNKIISDLKGEVLETPKNHPFLRTNAQDQNEEEQQSLAGLLVVKKRLAYPVEKNKNGYYALSNLSLEADKLVEFDKKIKLVKNVLRHLIIHADPMSPEQIKHIERLTAKKKAEKGGARKEPVKNKIKYAERSEKPAVAPAVAKKEPEEVEKVKPEKVEEEKKAPEEKKEEKKKEVEKKKASGKKEKIKLDDLEKKLDKILDETII